MLDCFFFVPFSFVLSKARASNSTQQQACSLLLYIIVVWMMISFIIIHHIYHHHHIIIINSMSFIHSFGVLLVHFGTRRHHSINRMPLSIHDFPLTAGQFGLRKCLCSNRKRQLRLRALVQRQFLTKTVEMRRRRIVAGGHLFTTTKG